MPSRPVINQEIQKMQKNILIFFNIFLKKVFNLFFGKKVLCKNLKNVAPCAALLDEAGSGRVWAHRI